MPDDQRIATRAHHLADGVAVERHDGHSFTDGPFGAAAGDGGFRLFRMILVHGRTPGLCCGLGETFSYWLVVVQGWCRACWNIAPREDAGCHRMRSVPIASAMPASLVPTDESA